MKRVDFHSIEKVDTIKYYVLVFTEDSFDNPYSLESRSYAFSTENKWFQPYAIGTSLFGYCLDKQDMGVRLDWYLHEWKIDYCYEITKEEFEELFN